MVIYLVYKYQSDISSSIALITLFVVSLYRMMPSLNRVISSYNGIVFNYRAIEILDNELNATIEDLGNKEIKFEKEIFIDNIYFSYYKEPSINNINNLILSNISLKIKKNQKIAFIGESGSGKSTLVDIISGFHTPNDGNIKVDGIIINMDNLKSWRQKIGYVPQQIYLFDGNIANNIALSNTYDEDRIKEVLKQANILDFLEKEQEGILTQVGESGIKLSGGQKQRIGIARALYSNPELLVLDEATSALDEATEKVIMEEIYQIAKNKTLIIIAHRLSTIKKCDIVYRVSRNKIVKELS